MEFYDLTSLQFITEGYFQINEILERKHNCFFFSFSIESNNFTLLSDFFFFYTFPFSQIERNNVL